MTREKAVEFDKQFFQSQRKEQSRKVYIYPALAQLWLDRRNKQNRGKGPADVRLYAEEMKAGRWRLVNQGIGFDWDGQITDGQTRLEAIVAADVPVYMYVATGQDPTNRLRVDCGRKRTTQHYLEMYQMSERANIAGRALWAIRMCGLQKKGRITGEATVELAKQYRKSLEWICSAVGSAPWNRAPIIGALAFAYERAPEVVSKAAKDLNSGLNISDTDPIYIFRETVRARAEKKQDKIDVFNKLLSAIYHRINGNSIAQLKTSDEAIKYFKTGETKRTRSKKPKARQDAKVFLFDIDNKAAK